MEKRFTTLRALATFFKVLAWISLVLALASAAGTAWGMISALSGDGTISLTSAWRIVGPIISLSLSIYYFIVFLLLGHLISLGVAIEENTRTTNIYLQRALQGPAKENKA